MAKNVNASSTATTAIRIYDNATQFTKAIAHVNGRQGVTTQIIQGLAVSSVLFACKDGNCNSSAVMFNDLHSSINRQALVHFLAKYGVKVGYNATAKQFTCKLNENIVKTRTELEVDRDAYIAVMCGDSFHKFDKTKDNAEFKPISVKAKVWASIASID